MPGGVDDELVERAENAAVPSDYRQLRACVRCHLVLPYKQFQSCARPPSPARQNACLPAPAAAGRTGARARTAPADPALRPHAARACACGGALSALHHTLGACSP
jgi:hypothetical protein